jgi:hypothetical protein
VRSVDAAMAGRRSPAASDARTPHHHYPAAFRWRPALVALPGVPSTMPRTRRGRPGGARRVSSLPAAADVAGLGLPQHGIVGSLARLLGLEFVREGAERQHDFVGGGVECSLAILQVREDPYAALHQLFERIGLLQKQRIQGGGRVARLVSGKMLVVGLSFRKNRRRSASTVGVRISRPRCVTFILHAC